LTGSPLVQLYCKKLAPSNLDGFLHAEPDHVGWKVNLAKASHDDLSRAAEAGAAMTRRLSSLGIISVFLLHPSTDAARMMALLDALRPDIFMASAERDVGTLMAVKASGLVGGIIVPVGIPVARNSLTTYDPVEEARRYAAVADWFTTDTITEADTPDRFGCSGRTSDWPALRAVVDAVSKPVVAAGGFTPGNVADLWRTCRPAGFDAHTSVCTDGLPDRAKSCAFATAVRALS